MDEHLGSRVILFTIFDAGLKLEHLSERRREKKKVSGENLNGQSSVRQVNKCNGTLV